MKIKAAKSSQNSQSTQGVGNANAASNGSEGPGTNLGREFHGIMETFADGLQKPAAEVSLDTFQVDPILNPFKLIDVQPTEVQSAMQASQALQGKSDLSSDEQDSPGREETLEQDAEKNADDSEIAKEITASSSEPVAMTQSQNTDEKELSKEDNETKTAETAAAMESSEQASDNASIELQGFDSKALSQKSAAPIANPKEQSANTKQSSSQSLELGASASATASKSENLGLTTSNSSASSIEVRSDLQGVMARLVEALQSPQAGSKSQPFNAMVGAEIGQMLKNSVTRELLTPNAKVSEQGVSAAAAAQNGASADSGAFKSFGAMQPLSTGEMVNARNSSGANTSRPLAQALAHRTLERVEQTLKEAARAKDGKSISLILNPTELGQVKVDVTLREGTLHARISAENTQVAQLLRERAHELQGMLRKLGLDVDNVTVAVHCEEQGFGQLHQDLGRRDSQQQSGNGTQTDAAGISNNAQLGGLNVGQLSNQALDHWVA